MAFFIETPVMRGNSPRRISDAVVQPVQHRETLDACKHL